LGEDIFRDEMVDVSDAQVRCHGDRWVDDHITTSNCSGMKSDYTIVFYGI